jgi:exopolysaccharide production protein ExoQ
VNQYLKAIENTFVVLSLFFFSQGLFSLFINVEELDLNPDASSEVLRTAAFVIYLITAGLLAYRWQETYRAIAKNKWILFLMVLSIVSIFWSSVPDIALKKVISLLGTTLFGIYLGAHYDFDRQVRFMGGVFGLSVVLSFVYGLGFPEYGIMNTNAIVGAWKGIYLHKSALGENMFLSFLMLYFFSELNPKYNIWGKITCALSVTLLVLSNSSTSTISLMFIFVLLNLLKHVSLRSKPAIAGLFFSLMLLVVAQLVLIFNLNGFLDASSKDITISGRTPLWETMWEFIQSKVWLGYGYGSFFSPEHFETQILWKEHTWGPSHAHNGYIQLWASLGVVGLVVFVGGYFYNLGRSLVSYLMFKNPRDLYIFSFLLYTVIFNLTEVSFLSTNHLTWVISVAYIYSLSSAGAAVPERSPHRLTPQMSVR